MKKTLTAAVATLGMVAAGAAVAGGPSPMAPPAPAPMVEWYIGGGISGNALTNVTVPGAAIGFIWGLGWEAMVGADIGDHWGLEANYTRVGNITVAGAVLRAQYGYVDALYRQMLFGPFYFVGKLGYGYGRVSLTVGGGTASINNFSLVYGAGFGIRFGAFGLRTMYSRFDILNVAAIDSVDLAAMWYFGS